MQLTTKFKNISVLPDTLVKANGGNLEICPNGDFLSIIDCGTPDVASALSGLIKLCLQESAEKRLRISLHLEISDE